MENIADSIPSIPSFLGGIESLSLLLFWTKSEKQNLICHITKWQEFIRNFLDFSKLIKVSAQNFL